MSPRFAMALTSAVGSALLVVGVLPQAADPIEITYVYSTDIAPLIEPQITEFNDGELTIEGRPVQVTGVALASGDAIVDIELGNVAADAWTPAASVWGALFDGGATDVSISTEIPALVTSPQVIAMWRDCAQELGWTPTRQPSWQDVIDVAGTDGRGTTHCRGFALGGTDPNKSTSGLLALAAWYEVATGQSPLTVKELRRNASARRMVRQVEFDVVRYWNTSSEVMDQICANEPPYVGGIYLQENTLVSNNNPGCLWKQNVDGMVAVYPSGGTFVADYPFYLVTRTDSSELNAQAAAQFGIWVRSRLTPDVSGAFGFRTADGIPDGLVDTTRGAIPELPTSKYVHRMPSGAVAEWLQSAWKTDCGSGCNVP